MLAISLALPVAVAIGGCASSGSAADRTDRSLSTIEACREHGGVAAFDDDAIICADQTSNDERGEAAVDACRKHGGVTAFDDDIVICDDQTHHEAKEG
jgi:hypothetical protein